ncbi:hypothetical protein D3C71_1681550 [compost metagenome]
MRRYGLQDTAGTPHQAGPGRHDRSPDWAGQAAKQQVQREQASLPPHAAEPDTERLARAPLWRLLDESDL